jgi:hypothetical protein
MKRCYRKFLMFTVPPKIVFAEIGTEKLPSAKDERECM